MTRSCLAASGLVLLCAACGGDDSAGDGAMDRDSAGIRIVENGTPPALWGAADSPSVRIGVVEGDSAYQLHDVRHAARTADGGVVVVDGGAHQVRWFDPAGTHRASMGRQGRGPGEFVDMTSAVLAPGDTLLVLDSRTRRVTRITRAGFVDERTLGDSRLGRSESILAAGSDGRLLIRADLATPDLTRAEYTRSRDTTMVLAFASPDAIDTIVRLPGTEALDWLGLNADGRPSYTIRMDLPFARRTLAAAHANGVVIADGSRRQMLFADAAGVVRRIVRRADDGPRAVSAAQRDSFIAHSVRLAREQGRVEPGVAAKNAGDRVGMLPADHPQPAFDRLLVDPAGPVWLRTFTPAWKSDEVQHWTVFDADGRAIARATTPAGVEVMHVRDGHVTGLVRDSLDVQYVVVHAIRTP